MATMDVHSDSGTLNETTYTATTVELDQPNVRKKQPKRILHFSDGILEEYSSDDSDNEDAVPETKIDPSMLAWTPWCLYYMTFAARKSLAAAEFCGEKLAWLFGITTPKYQYAIEEYKRMEKEIELEKMRNQKLHEEVQGLSTVDIQIVGVKNAKGNEKSTPSVVDTAEKY